MAVEPLRNKYSQKEEDPGDKIPREDVAREVQAKIESAETNEHNESSKDREDVYAPTRQGFPFHIRH